MRTLIKQPAQFNFKGKTFASVTSEAGSCSGCIFSLATPGHLLGCRDVPTCGGDRPAPGIIFHEVTFDPQAPEMTPVMDGRSLGLTRMQIKAQTQQYRNEVQS